MNNALDDEMKEMVSGLKVGSGCEPMPLEAPRTGADEASSIRVEVWRKAIDILLRNTEDPNSPSFGQKQKDRTGAWGIELRSLLMDQDDAGRFIIPDKHVFPDQYYWDSAAIMLGILESGSAELIQIATEALNNFFGIVERFGFIPNASNSALETRSQPPFLSTLVRKFVEKGHIDSSSDEGQRWLERAYRCVRREYDVWSERTALGLNVWFDTVGDAKETEPGDLAQYFRVESRSDARIIRSLFLRAGISIDVNPKSDPEVIKNLLEGIFTDWTAEQRSELRKWLISRRLLSACGMDFSASYGTRYIADVLHLVMDLTAQSEGGIFYREDLIRSTIDDCVPVDLNALLFKYCEDCIFILTELEKVGVSVESDEFQFWRGEAESRRESFQSFWSESKGYFCNILIDPGTGQSRHLGEFLHLAELVYPLWSGLATKEQADRIIPKIEQLVTPFGVHMSLVDTGCQWDFNMWPFQAMLTTEALLRYGQTALADKVARGYCKCVEKVYRSSDSIFEKYNPLDGSLKTSGRYPAAGDFSWGAGAYMFLRSYLNSR